MTLINPDFGAGAPMRRSVSLDSADVPAESTPVLGDELYDKVDADINQQQAEARSLEQARRQDEEDRRQKAKRELAERQKEHSERIAAQRQRLKLQQQQQQQQQKVQSPGRMPSAAGKAQTLGAYRPVMRSKSEGHSYGPIPSYGPGSGSSPKPVRLRDQGGALPLTELAPHLLKARSPDGVNRAANRRLSVQPQGFYDQPRLVQVNSRRSQTLQRHSYVNLDLNGNPLAEQDSQS